MALNFDGQPIPKFSYSPAVSMGPFVKTAGMVGLDPVTEALAPGGASEEFRQILSNLERLMTTNGLEASEVMSATIYTTAFHVFPSINDIWNAFFAGADQFPARSSVGVSQLPIGAQIEVEFLFYKTPDKKVSV